MHTSRLQLGLLVVGLALAGCGRQVPRGPVADAAAVKEIRMALGGVEAATGVAAVSTGTGWAKLSGVVKIAGDPPAPSQLDINKDTGTCAPGGQKVFSHALLVDKGSKGIANVAIYVRKASRVHETASAAPTGPAIFDQKECMFLTPLLACRAGQVIQVKNSDPILHNANLLPKDNAGANFSVPGGSSSPYTAKNEEKQPFPVSCGVHPWMSAFIMPRANNYFAVTKADGSFEIANLPDGEDLEIQIWHEMVNPQNKIWELANADVKCNPKGQFKLKLEENKDKVVTIEIPAKLFSK